MAYPLQSDDTGKLILRLTLGVLLLLHGIAKATNPEGVGGISGMLVAKGLPGFIAYGAYIGELLAPVMIILGIFCRIGGLLALAHMIVAISLVHAQQIFTMGKQGGWALELQGFYLFCALALYFLGSGKFAVKPD
jgi:putative oxidoreductase